MRISLFVIFAVIARAFSKDTRVLEGEFKLDFGTRFSSGSYFESTDSASELEKDAFRVFNVLEKKLRNVKAMKDVTLQQALLTGLQPGFTEKQCTDLSGKLCSVLKSNHGAKAVFRELSSACSVKENPCGDLFKYLENTCNEVKNNQTSISAFTEDVCKIEIEKCCDLKEHCKDILLDSCKTVEEKCLGSKSHLEVPAKVDFTKTHTVITVSTVVVTETAPETFTYTKTLIETETCCLGKLAEITQEKPSEEPKPPEESEAPEESEVPEELEPPEESEPPQESESPQESEPSQDTVSSEESKPLEEPTIQESDDSGQDTESECSVIETITVTVTPGESTDVADEKGRGARVDGLQKAGLICAIIGMTLGIWIIV